MSQIAFDTVKWTLVSFILAVLCIVLRVAWLFYNELQRYLRDEQNSTHIYSDSTDTNVQNSSATISEPEFESNYKPQTIAGRFFETLLLNIAEVVDPIAKILLGDWRGLVYKTVQDTISLIIIFKIPGYIWHVFTGDDLSGLSVCQAINIWDVSRYICFYVVFSDYAVLIGLFGRLLVNTYVEIRQIITRE